MAKVVCLGDICIDEVITCERYPAPGGESEVRSVERRPGGSAANCAFALAYQGVPVALAARVGNDGFWLREALSRAGVGTQAVQVDDRLPTGIVRIIVSSDGERTMFCQRGANTRLKAWESSESLDGAKVLHISGYALMEPEPRDAVFRAVELARQRGLMVSVDPGVAAAHSKEVRKALLDLWGHVDITFPNEMELDVLTESLGPEFLFHQGVGQIVVTRSARGAELFTREGRFFAPGFPTEVVDTTGAGDAFAAGYLYGLIKNLPPQECLEAGNRMGALAVGTIGPLGWTQDVETASW